MITTVASKSRQVSICPEGATVIIGERINPTGRKRFGEALLSGNLDLLQKEAVSQQEQGADIIDVNVGVAGIDEILTLPRAVKLVAEASYLPISIDSSDPVALEAALKVYDGKALVNSVTGEKDSLRRVLPVIRHYGAAVIGLCHDELGVARDPLERLEVAKKIIDMAVEAGISTEDILLDPLVLTVSAEPQAALWTYETAALIRRELGVNMTMGASNVSFGLPERVCLNNVFIATAISYGVNSLIVNPGAKDLMQTVLAADIMAGRDEYAMRFLRFCREKSALQAGQPQNATPDSRG